ncbi:MAG: hypothetical protein COV29_00770 [Candidatus Yanofskybacteria bacterium CG10_big_fil_rev_8_21_14_0_10_36_16]|uniref:Uncharacterized protein n=1 Tax=Candidatus Yanofskybacteria bacterium CG10_big_fil_rev_8_21_14_0_10_36_16 TaxID=1975096 RepID=A0A2J0Q800_9BACT|nr:MAG: hypothetical protein COV29_00770 [Candidatus Yanofskybacteria bacterium CG10_big_fil_rev_8_21_14_0_10_36_16]
MLGICPSFIQYLNETAPSLFYQVPLDSISFRWKIPNNECLGGWIGKSGIDTIKELSTDELCGFAGLHFPGREFLEILVSSNSGPYTPVDIVDSMLSFFLDRSRDLKEIYRNEFITHFAGDIRYQAILATEQGCVLRYATEKTESPIVLTRQDFLNLFPKKTLH